MFLDHVTESSCPQTPGIMLGQTSTNSVPPRAIRGPQPWCLGRRPVQWSQWEGITLWVKGRLVPLRGMGCMERAFGDCAILVRGCLGGRSKAGKGSNKDGKHYGKNCQEKGTEGGGCTYTVHLSGHALCVISVVCPVFIIAFFYLFWLPVHGIGSVQVGLNTSNWTDLSACILCGCACPCVITSKMKSEGLVRKVTDLRARTWHGCKFG